MSRGERGPEQIARLALRDGAIKLRHLSPGLQVYLGLLLAWAFLGWIGFFIAVVLAI